MALGPLASWMLAQEARALLTRLNRVKPFALHETMVPAAAVSRAAQTAIESYLAEGRNELQHRVRRYIHWLSLPEGQRASPAEAQRRFTMLRLRFNAVLSQFDIFADVLSQRSEHETGVWLAGLDVVAADALTLPGDYFRAPPVVCYLDRGGGAAIRRARTRLPGGGANPCAVVRIPRERMLGSAVAGSLIHECGHQAAALLGLVPSLGQILRGMFSVPGRQQLAWRYWERCLGEIVSDLYSIARVGVTSTQGLMAVVSLPRAFVFRFSFDDPHPFPWIRVKLSCAIGNALLPHPQWKRLADLWASYYPTEPLDEPSRQWIATLESTIPAFVSLLVNHRPLSLRGVSLKEALGVDARQPKRLELLWRAWRAKPSRMRQAPPCDVFAVVGQAKVDGNITPEEESKLLAEMLTHWALRNALTPDSANIAVNDKSRRLSWNYT